MKIRLIRAMFKRRLNFIVISTKWEEKSERKVKFWQYGMSRGKFIFRLDGGKRFLDEKISLYPREALSFQNRESLQNLSRMCFHCIIFSWEEKSFRKDKFHSVKSFKKPPTKKKATKFILKSIDIDFQSNGAVDNINFPSFHCCFFCSWDYVFEINFLFNGLMKNRSQDKLISWKLHFIKLTGVEFKSSQFSSENSTHPIYFNSVQYLNSSANKRREREKKFWMKKILGVIFFLWLIKKAHVNHKSVINSS